MNALRVDDYSVAEWKAVEAKARAHGWQPPCDAACLRAILREGYVDGFRVACAVAEGDPLPGGPAKFSAHTEDPLYRIDYVFLSPGVELAGLRLQSAFVEASSAG